MPNLPDKARKTVAGMCDMVLYFDSVDETDDDGKVKQKRITSRFKTIINFVIRLQTTKTYHI